MNYALSIPEVNKYKPTVVSATVNPTSQSYLAPHMLFSKLTTAMALEQNRLLTQAFQKHYSYSIAYKKVVFNLLNSPMGALLLIFRGCRGKALKRGGRKRLLNNLDSAN